MRVPLARVAGRLLLPPASAAFALVWMLTTDEESPLAPCDLPESTDLQKRRHPSKE